MVRTVDAYEDLNVPAGMFAQGQFLGLGPHYSPTIRMMKCPPKCSCR